VAHGEGPEFKPQYCQKKKQLKFIQSQREDLCVNMQQEAGPSANQEERSQEKPSLPIP
jgi:hypothetical protein